MKILKSLCLISALICSSSGYAESKRLDVEELFNNSSEELSSPTSLLLRYQSVGTKIKHNETSSVSGFTSLGEESDISVMNFSVELGQEFFSENYFSISVGVRLGISKGSDEAVNDTANLSYKDKVSGKSYGAGLSLNLNTKGYGLRIQPFISSYYMINKNDYNLSYNAAGSTDDPFNIKYSADTNVLQHSLGLKFINNRNSLMSSFSIDYIQQLDSSSTSSSGNQAGQDLQLSNISSVKQNDFGFSIGIGLIF